MITEEERAKLKVGDVVYLVENDDDNEPDYFKFKISGIIKDTLVSGSFNLYAKNEFLFKNRDQAIKKVIELYNTKIDALLFNINIFTEQLAQDNG